MEIEAYVYDFKMKLEPQDTFYNKQLLSGLIDFCITCWCNTCLATLTTSIGQWEIPILEEQFTRAMYFGENWKEFVDMNQLQFGDVLSFKHCGKLQFDVIVMKAATKIDKQLSFRKIMALPHGIVRGQVLIPAIKAKWPPSHSKHIIIQQDNAKPHLKGDNEDFRVVVNTNGFNMKLICQPVNSLDTNVNDLGFFRAIQSLQTSKAASNVDDLMRNVSLSFEELQPQTLNNVFITLQSCYIEMMKINGGNNYKTPHMNKGRLQAAGILPEVLEVDEGLVRQYLHFLRLPENEIGSEYDIQSLMTSLGC